MATPRGSLTVLTVYRSDIFFTEFDSVLEGLVTRNTEFDSVLEGLVTRNTQLLIIGDFNIHVF